MIWPFHRRKPCKPCKPRITCPETADTLARIITRTQHPTHTRDTPETVRETWINDNTPDQIARRGEGQ